MLCYGPGLLFRGPLCILKLGYVMQRYSSTHKYSSFRESDGCVLGRRFEGSRCLQIQGQKVQEEGIHLHNITGRKVKISRQPFDRPQNHLTSHVCTLQFKLSSLFNNSLCFIKSSNFFVYINFKFRIICPWNKNFQNFILVSPQKQFVYSY